MSRQLKISLLRAERQGEAGYEAAKGGRCLHSLRT